MRMNRMRSRWKRQNPDSDELKSPLTTRNSELFKNYSHYRDEKANISVHFICPERYPKIYIFNMEYLHIYS